MIKFNGKIRALSYEAALVEFLNLQMKWMSVSDISKEMGIPYTTINHRLNSLAKRGEIVAKEDRTPRIGRPRTLYGSVELVKN